MNLQELADEDVWLIGLCRRYGEIFSNQELMEQFVIKGLICGWLVALERASGRTVLLDSARSPAGEEWYYPV